MGQPKGHAHAGTTVDGPLRAERADETGDTADEQLARTWVAAEDLRLIYPAGDRARAEQAPHQWLAYCAEADIPELHRLARTIDSGRVEFLAYLDTDGISNGPTEAFNLLIKKIKRVGYGFRRHRELPTAALRR